jgi:hypothetical protein
MFLQSLVEFPLLESGWRVVPELLGGDAGR